MKKAFTLVELLVVIAIIALLMAILMPSLQAARAQAQRVVCLSHLGQLGLGWVCYAQDNDELIVNGQTSAGKGALCEDETYERCWINGFCSVKKGNSVEECIASIEDGLLYPYCQDYKLYACPTSEKGEFVTYSICDSMNGHWNFSWKDEILPDKSLLTIKKPDRRMVFADEGEIDGAVSYTAHYDKERWWDFPSKRHSDGMTFSFADGHSEYWKWMDKRTIELANDHDYEKTQLGNQDLYRVQIAIWGKLGYTPTETPIW